MGVNRVDFGGNTLIDLTGDTLESAEQLLKGIIAHAKDGSVITGQMEAGGGGGIEFPDRTAMVYGTYTPATENATDKIYFDNVFYNEGTDRPNYNDCFFIFLPLIDSFLSVASVSGATLMAEIVKYSGSHLGNGLNASSFSEYSITVANRYYNILQGSDIYSKPQGYIKFGTSSYKKFVVGCTYFWAIFARREE